MPTNASSLLLNIAVVGHTNTGKTSLLRTLTRDRGFGAVEAAPGTTRHVEGVRLDLGESHIHLFDTPGIEDSMALLDYIERLVGQDQRVSGPERIRLFLDSPEAKGRFEQEARVLKQLMDCAAGLYVVDVRDPVLAKHKDELRILGWCGKPLLPVLNFLRHQPTRLSEWQQALADLGLHAHTQFDTVAPALDGEITLYQKLGLLLAPQQSRLLENFGASLQRQRAQRLADAKQLLAELLIDVAAWQRSCSADPDELEAEVQAMQEMVRAREQHCVYALLQRYQFSQQDYLPLDLTTQGYRWELDLFHPEVLKQMGLQLGKGVATGAVAGATFDLLTAGLSLGTGTLVGATVGGVWQGVNEWGQKIMRKWRGQADLSVDDAVLRALALRQLALIQALEQRGHAAQEPIQLDATEWAETSGAPASAPTLAPASSAPAATAFDWRRDPLPPVLVQARHHPQWCQMLYPEVESTERQTAIQALARQLQPQAG